MWISYYNTISFYVNRSELPPSGSEAHGFAGAVQRRPGWDGDGWEIYWRDGTWMYWVIVQYNYWLYLMIFDIFDDTNDDNWIFDDI